MPTAPAHDVLGVIVEWFDPNPQYVYQYILKYFIKTHEVELVERKKGRLFLKRTGCPAHVSTKELYIGSKFSLFGRTFTVVDYADKYTRTLLSPASEKSIILVPNSSLTQLGNILETAIGRESQRQLLKLKLFKFTRPQAASLSSVLPSAMETNGSKEYDLSGSCVFMQFMGKDCNAVSQKIAMDYNVITGGNEEVNDSILEYLYSNELNAANTATFDNKTTCCVIKPHAVKEGKMPAILNMIQSSGEFRINALEGFDLDLVSAKEFLEVYKGVVPEYKDMSEELSEGMCVAMEIIGDSDDTQKRFRELVGPWDVDMAKELRPNSIRAQYGIDKVYNAIHCTDLPEDAILENQFFFALLQK